jgi:ribosomal-protein-alanine N-acetyltransferase
MFKPKKAMPHPTSDLKTERLQLSAMTMQDLDNIHALHSLPETDRYNTLGIPASRIETEQLLTGWLSLMNLPEQPKYVFVIRSESGDFIGLTGINIGRPVYRNAEIWYKLHPAHWNQGYATEAVAAILHFCFHDLQLHRVKAGCATENTASAKVLEKSGFLREGTCRKNLPIRGEWFDNYEYAILEEEYFARS